ncbi:MAG: DNA repair protein RadC [uncultured bacterium]|nr:MAG: DNA repair protein RadC [uncultured bacterium]
MSITNWPAAERPREKLLEHGAKNLSDAELLAIFIRNGTKGKTAVDLARTLLNYFGGLRNLLDAGEDQICSFPGLGKAKYAELQATLEISRRHLAEQLIRTNVISNAETAYLYLTAKLRNYQHEVFACLFLDNQNRVIHYEELFHGTINSTTVYPREIVKTALHHNAAAVIFAHNHTSGTPTPSLQDKQLTKTLTKILCPLDIKVLDHIIIGNNSYIALAGKEF